MNILTDAALVVIPSIIVLPVQMSWGKRFTILGGFWTRLLAIGASIVQIVFIRQLFTTDEDFLYGVYREVISMELVQTVGIMTACVPFLKPFLMSLESGFLRADDVNRQLTITTKNSSKQASTNRYIEIQKQRNLHSKVSLVHTQVPVNGEGQA
ncbi:hypothetical protein B0T17DRAFT_531643 [Bombardia bombarda]|uniref:Rhodopsin domain-containing protein n=1 Tax=Bombardia bombarda TaxID=252184 RepID=A0AA39X0G1_9PEZI|nr:hypothetical protein B0T17DRAFT_531643 [Bombardia bombarda]